MAKFPDIINSPPGSKFILQGNTAFALGVIHAGYHAATEQKKAYKTDNQPFEHIAFPSA